jgi:hypothetical protein
MRCIRIYFSHSLVLLNLPRTKLRWFVSHQSAAPLGLSSTQAAGSGRKPPAFKARGPEFFSISHQGRTAKMFNWQLLAVKQKLFVELGRGGNEIWF